MKGLSKCSVYNYGVIFLLLHSLAKAADVHHLPTPLLGRERKQEEDCKPEECSRMFFYPWTSCIQWKLNTFPSKVGTTTFSFLLEAGASFEKGAIKTEYWRY